MSETYRLTLRHSGPWVGAEDEETYDLSEYGYTDEEWDALTATERDDLLIRWSEQEFWNAGYEYSGEVSK